MNLTLLGVGIGPFNLSLAALLHPIRHLSYSFFDNKSEFGWHNGMLLPESTLQINPLQDLVTPVAPTNPYSFLAYLVKHKRFNRYLYANFNTVLRNEFAMYLQWASLSIKNLFFDESIQNIEFKNDLFHVTSSKSYFTASNLALGSGLTPHIPEFGKSFLGKDVFHSENFLQHKHKWKNKRIAVVGGGQSSAEIVNHLLANSQDLPAEISWISTRHNLVPLDTSPFANEYFTSAYTNHFYQLSEQNRQSLLHKQTYASDGITPELLDQIYQRVYSLEFVEQQERLLKYFLNHSLVEIKKCQSEYDLSLQTDYLNLTRQIQADIIIFCTGYKWQLPDYLSQLQPRLLLQNGRFCVNDDYSIVWDGPKQNRIYVQNSALHSHGIADPNLCIMARRNAVIINSLTNKYIYDIEEDSTTVDWHEQTPNRHNHGNIAYA